ncbi:MAG: nitronate monooxygenase, partial [Firmicutes bacterium]|nr:nitronate monooxygenase [Bacillota bacterium]
GADALSCINTVVGLAIDIERRRPALGGITGGLSGPAIKPVALRVVWEVSQAVPVPVIGVGGISSPRDVLEFLMAGARAVMVGTLTFRDPGRLLELVETLPATLAAAGFRGPGEAVGAAHPRHWRREAADLPEDFV